MKDNEARQLILQKLHDLVANELSRYLKSEQRLVINIFENLFDKYFIPLSQIHTQRDEANKKLNTYLKQLKYQ